MELFILWGQEEQILDEGDLQCIDNDLTTCIRKNYEEKTDWILASQPTVLFINSVKIHPPLWSKGDHKPLIFNLNMSADRKPVSPRLWYNFNVTNWKLYRNKLNDLLDKIDIKKTITTTQQTESYAAIITKCITLATTSAIPLANESLKTYSR